MASPTPARRESSVSSSSSPQCVSVASAPPPPPQKNVSRERMKSEKAFLSKRVVELERELSHLLAKRALARCATPSPVWKGLAKRQFARRQRAIEENDRLKTRLLHQIQVAKSLETVLRNRSSAFLDDLGTGASSTSVKYPFRDLAALHTQCMDEIDQAYPLVDSVFAETDAEAASGDVQTATGLPLRRSTVISKLENGDEKLYVELRDSIYVPFPHDRVCRATWRAITTEYVRQNRLIEQHCCTDDEYAIKFWLHQCLPEHQRQNSEMFSATTSMRKFCEDHRTVIVWRSLNWKKTTPLGDPSEYGDETGWLVVERVADPVTGEPSEDAAVVRVCTRYMPIWEGSTKNPSELLEHDDDDKSCRQNVGDFTNQILNGTEEDIAAITEAIENILLDESIGSSEDDLESMVHGLGALPDPMQLSLPYKQ